MGTFAEYLVAREANRKVFSLNQGNALDAFEVSLTAFAALGEQLRTGRDRNNKTHISLAPFFFILQRQTIAAYDALSTNQAYLGWVSLRTGVESALIMGKWVDDRANADIWERRFDNPKPYREVYQGAALASKSLLQSDKIQRALSHINDLFPHPNPRYYYRHLGMKPLADGDVSMELDFFDATQDVDLGLFGILHLVATIQDRLAQMFADLFVGASKVDIRLGDLEAKAATWRASLEKNDPNAEWLLVNIGLWPPAT
jgi:hypothetical protein